MRVRRILARPLVRRTLLLVTFAFIAWELRRHWAEVQAAPATLVLHWGWIATASAIVLLTYAALIQSWRMLLGGFGGELRYGSAARIWTIANLGRWIPGKFWSVGALGLLSQREGVSGVAATGAALLGTALNLGAGFGITVLAGASGLDAIRPGFQAAAYVGSAAFVIGVLLLPLLLPRVLGVLARWRRMPAVSRQLPTATLWTATLINALSWIGYGTAFALFSRGVTPQVSSDPMLMVAAFSASYIIGYLVLFSPGGLGVREASLVTLLVAIGAAGRGDALLLAATSRVWLTVLEVLPGLVSLLLLPAAQRTALRRAG